MRFLVKVLVEAVARPLTSFAFALASYFGLLARLPIGSAALSKATGVAQALVGAEAVAPEPQRRSTTRLLAPLTLLARLRCLR